MTEDYKNGLVKRAKVIAELLEKDMDNLCREHILMLVGYILALEGKHD